MPLSRPAPLACWAAITMALLGGCAKNSDNGSAAENAAYNAAYNAQHAPPAEAIDDNAMPGNAAGDDAARLPTDDWVGRWDGPEGLFLDIQPSPDGKPGHYAIANKDMLDRQDDYVGVAEGPQIRFVRDGKDLSIRAGSGEETGFKYLAEKTDCLIVRAGREGYCR